MTNHIIRPIAAAAALLALGTAQAQVSDNVVRLGVMTDMSGIFSDFAGKGSVEAVRMAVEDMGGRIGDAPIEVVSADHQNKADVTSAKAREWFDNGKVDMITDLVGSSPSLAALEVGAQKHKVVMVSGAYSSRISNESCNPYSVHMQIDTTALASTPRLLTKQGGDSWFFVTADYAFGQAMEHDATEAILAQGGKVVGGVKHPFNAPDYSSYMLKAQSSGAKMVALASAGGDLVNAVKSAQEFGLMKSGKQSVAAMAILISDVHALGLPLAQGLYTVEGFYWDQTPETRAFAQRFHKRMNKMPTSIHAAAYSAALTYLRAVKATGTDDADRVMKQMKSAPLDDIWAGHGSIRADGRLMKDIYLLQVKKPAESTRPWDYYHVRGTVKAEDAFRPLAKSTCPLVQTAKAGAKA